MTCLYQCQRNKHQWEKKGIRVKLTRHGVKAIAHHEAKAHWSIARIKLSNILQIIKIIYIWEWCKFNTTDCNNLYKPNNQEGWFTALSWRRFVCPHHNAVSQKLSQLLDCNDTGHWVHAHVQVWSQTQSPYWKCPHSNCYLITQSCYALQHNARNPTDTGQEFQLWMKPVCDFGYADGGMNIGTICVSLSILEIC